MRIIIHVLLISCYAQWLCASQMPHCQQRISSDVQDMDWPGVPGEILAPEEEQGCAYLEPSRIDVTIAPKGGHIKFINNEGIHQVTKPVIMTGPSSLLQLCGQNWHKKDRFGNRQPKRLNAPEVHFFDKVGIYERGKFHIEGETRVGVLYEAFDLGEKSAVLVEKGGTLKLHNQVDFAPGSIASIKNHGRLECSKKCRMVLSGYQSEMINGSAIIQTKDASFIMRGSLHLKGQAAIRLLERAQVALLGPVVLENQHRSDTLTFLQMGNKNFFDETSELIIANKLTLGPSSALLVQGGHLRFKKGAEIILPLENLNWETRIGLFFRTKITMDELTITMDTSQIYWPPSYQLIIIEASSNVRLGSYTLSPPGYALALESITHVSSYDGGQIIAVVRKAMPGGYTALAVSDKARRAAMRVDALIEGSETRGLTYTEQRFIAYLDTRPDQESFDRMLAEAESILDSFMEERRTGAEEPQIIEWPDVLASLQKMSSFFMEDSKVIVPEKQLKRDPIQEISRLIEGKTTSEWVAYSGTGLILLSVWLRHQLR